MTNSARWTPSPFAAIATLTLMAAVGLMVAAQPAVTEGLKGAAVRQAALAASLSDSAQAIARYRLAQALDPSNAAYRQRMADLYIGRGQVGEAIDALGNTPEERSRKAGLLVEREQYAQALSTLDGLTDSASRLQRSRIYLEQGSAANAASAVDPAHNDAERLQLGLSLLYANRPVEAQQLKIGDAKGSQSLKRALPGNLSLAQELYAQKLYHACLAVLAQSDDSSGKFLLEANAQLALPQSKERLANAQSAAEQGVRLDPANLQLHQLLHDIYSQQGDKTAADHQAELIKQLRAGNI